MTSKNQSEQKDKKSRNNHNLIIYCLIGAIGVIFVYLNHKAENLATKQDIADITRKVEEVKKDVKLSYSLEIEKRKLKYEALFCGLTLIDAYFSHMNWENVEIPSVKQYSTTVEARKCHNKLILTVDNPKIVEVFLKILFNKQDEIHPTEKLNKFRNLVREENLKFPSKHPFFG